VSTRRRSLGCCWPAPRAGQRRPAPVECLDLLRGALWMRLRPTVARSDRAAFAAVKLMCLGAVVELAAAVVIVATIGDVRANLVKRDPGLTQVQWHGVVADQLEPVAVAAGIAVGFWLWIGAPRGRRPDPRGARHRGRRPPHLPRRDHLGHRLTSILGLSSLSKVSSVAAHIGRNLESLFVRKLTAPGMKAVSTLQVESAHADPRTNPGQGP
jgi:hypothetical protein